MEPTIISSALTWAINPVSTGVIGNLAYDGLKKLAKPFVDRFKRFFGNEDEAEQYYERLCSDKSRNPEKPYRDIEALYEVVTSSTLENNAREELLAEMKSWIRENQELIVSMGVHQHDNEFRINVHSQSAKQILNVQGTVNINEMK